MKNDPEELIKQLESKYKGKTLTPRQVLDFRNELTQKYGEKIIPGMRAKLTIEETFARKEYELLSKELYKIAPDVEKADKLELEAIKTQKLYKNIFGFIKKPFQTVLSVFQPQK